MQEKKLTGYPSIDKPWLKYYSEEAINAPLPEGTAFDYLYELNCDRNKAALEYFGRKISFVELFANISKVEKALLKYGVQSGDIVTVSIPNIPEAAYLFYALRKIGAVANMVDPRTSTLGIQEYIKESYSKIVIMVDVAISKIADVQQHLPFVETVISVSPAESLPIALKVLYKVKNNVKLPSHVISWDKFIKDGKEQAAEKSCVQDGKADKPVLIVHTGGTTGTPKGVVLSNLNINAIAFQSMRFPTDLQPKHTWLDIMPPFIAYGIGTGLHFPLAVGMTVILIPKFDADKFDELLIKHKPNHLSGVPSHWHTIINSQKMQKQDMSYLISAAVGGDSMGEQLERDSNEYLKAHNCEYGITKGYGMTETNGSVCRTLNENNPIGNVGIPSTHTVVSVFDPETGEELQYNQIGEICMSGPSVMLGYYNNPDETSKIKRNHNGLDWIYSGDLGYMTEEGNIYILNRAKRIIERFDGFKIFPSQIENTISKSQSVNGCCAVGVPDKTHSQGQLPIAFVVKSGNESDDAVKTELFELCQTELPEYAQPIGLVFIDALPLTPIGKIDYRALEKQAEEMSKT